MTTPQDQSIGTDKIQNSVREIEISNVEPASDSEIVTNIESKKSDFNISFHENKDFLNSAQSHQKTGKLAAKTILINDVTLSDRKEMWALYSQYYDGATWASFNEDMDEKTHIIVARDNGDDSIQGFSTIKLYNREIDSENILALYSGDTIIHPDYWGQKALHMAFFKFVAITRIKNPLANIFWYLLCNGFKTYLIFARNIPNHWPRHDQATPERELRIINTLSAERFGKSFDPEKGVVKFMNNLGLLKSHVAPIGAHELAHPDIRFLVEKNPGYINGDELCCIGEINYKLFLYYPFKLLKKEFMRKLLKLWGRNENAGSVSV